MHHAALPLLRTYFQVASFIAPRPVARHAFELCFSPMRPRITDDSRTLLERAESIPIDIAGLQLKTYRWRSNGGRSRRTVLLVHGWNSRAGRLVEWVQPLLSRGFDVIAADMPGHGDSEGKHSNGLLMAAAIGSISSATGPLHGIVGHSAGAFAAAMAVAGGHLLGRPPVALNRLVLIAPVDNPRLHLAGFAAALGLSDRLYDQLVRLTIEEFGHSMETYSLTRIPQGWQQPTLLIHDPADAEIPYSESEAIAAACPNAMLVPMSGLGHHRIARDPKVISVSIDFLNSDDPHAAQTNDVPPRRPEDRPGRSGNRDGRGARPGGAQPS